MVILMPQTRQFVESTWVIKLVRDFLYNTATRPGG